MNIFNKNLLRRRLSIFLLLMLYVGLCFEAAAFPPDVMAVGELHELDAGYSIAAVEADVDTGEALFILYKEGRAVDETAVSSGELFSLDDGENFYFEATLDSVFRDGDTIMVELTGYNWEWMEPQPAEEGVMAVGELHELDAGYLIEVVEADVDTGEAGFVLFKEGRVIDETRVSSGEWFSLDDGEIFHFEATLDSVFRYEETIMVRLTDIDNWYNADAETIPEEEWPEGEWPEGEWNDESPNPIPSIIVVMIMFIFVIFISIRLKTRVGRQKIEGYKAKMHKLEKEGYDVSELKRVLEGKK